MNEQNNIETLVLKLHPIWLGIFAVFGLGGLGGGGYLILQDMGYFPVGENGSSPGLGIFFIILGALFCFATYAAAISRLTFDDKGAHTKIFNTKTLLWEEMKNYGYSEGNLWIMPTVEAKKRKRKNVVVSYAYKGHKKVEPLLRSRGLRDLHEEEQEKEWKQFSEDEDLGNSEEEKLDSLSRTKHLNRGLIGLGIVINAAFLFGVVGPATWFWVLIFIPPAILALAAVYRHYFKMNSKAKDVFPNPIPAIAIAFFAFMLLCFEVGWVSFRPFWLPGLCSALVLWIAFLFVLRDFKKGEFKVGAQVFFSLVLFVMMGLYTFSAIGMYNYVYPNHLETHKTVILDKRASSDDDDASFYFEVGPWGPREENNEIVVDQQEYDRASNPGDSILIGEFGGWLGVKFYRVKVFSSETLSIQKDTTHNAGPDGR